MPILKKYINLKFIRKKIKNTNIEGYLYFIKNILYANIIIIKKSGFKAG